ncbi:hypothetical protein PAXINDRAFT_25880, partial [Paxillus involutus ATCC 200175]
LPPFCTAVKQRSWILTTFSNAVMSVCRLLLFLEYTRASGDLKNVSTSSNDTDGVARFFQAYLIAILLTMGLYRSKLNLLPGWIHHYVYVLVIEYALQTKWSHIFCLCTIMEIPTFILALASVNPRLCSDVLFAVCFFITHIALHAVLGISLVIQRNDVVDESVYPRVLMACIFPLHDSHWFSGCIKDFLKR